MTDETPPPQPSKPAIKSVPAKRKLDRRDLLTRAFVL
jgi:hypothetical protein